MRKVFTVILIITLMTLTSFAFIPNQAYAGSVNPSDMISSADSFIEKGKGESKLSTADVKNEVLPIANILVGIASVIFVIVGGILGVQYAFGGADQKAGIKQKLIWFVVAVVLVYGAVGIYNIAVTVMSNLSN